MKYLNQYQIVYSIIILLILFVSVVNTFHFLFVKVLVSLLAATAIIFFLNMCALRFLQNWLEKKIIMDLQRYKKVPRNYVYLPVEKQDFLKIKVLKLTTTDQKSSNDDNLKNYKTRLSEAELESIEELFKDVLALEILVRLKKLSNGETKILRFLGVNYDLYGLASLNFILLLFLFIIALILYFDII